MDELLGQVDQTLQVVIAGFVHIARFLAELNLEPQVQPLIDRKLLFGRRGHMRAKAGPNQRFHSVRMLEMDR